MTVRLLSYSCRKASTGRTCAARKAGSHAATMLVTMNSVAAAIIVPGSPGETPYNSEATSRDAANASGPPIRTPRAATTNPSRMTIRVIDHGVAPMLMRILVSTAGLFVPTLANLYANDSARRSKPIVWTRLASRTDVRSLPTEADLRNLVALSKSAWRRCRSVVVLLSGISQPSGGAQQEHLDCD